MKIILFLTFFLLSVTPTLAVPTHDWSQLISGPRDVDGISVDVDSDKNIFITGQFTDTLFLGPQTIISNGARDVFVAKFSPDGTPLWGINFGGLGNDSVSSISVSPIGDVSVIGSFSGSITIFENSFQSNGLSDIFVATFDSGGKYVWARTLGGSGNDLGMSLKYFFNGNLSVAAAFQGTVDFPGERFTSNGSYDGYIGLLEGNSGNGTWSKQIGLSNSEIIKDITASTNKIFITGYFEKSTNVGGETLNSIGPTDAFVAAYSIVEGIHLWSKQLGSSYAAAGEAIDFFQNEIIFTGTYKDNVDKFQLQSKGGFDIFLTRMTENGSTLWVRDFGGPTDDNVRDISLNKNSESTIIGSFQINTKMGGDQLNSMGRFDVLMAMHDSNGEHLWSDNYGNLVSDKGNSVVFDSNSSFIATGFTLWKINFNGNELTSIGGADAFLVKFNHNPQPTAPVSTNTATPTYTSTVAYSPTASTKTPTSTPTNTQKQAFPQTPTLTKTFTAVPTIETVDITGKIFYSNNKPIPGATIYLNSIPRTVSNMDGNFSFEIEKNSFNTITVRLNSPEKHAISSLDATRALQYVVGKIQLDKYQKVAADVTGNGTISSLDGSRIMQYNVGLIDKLPVCDDTWVFFPIVGVDPQIAANECKHGSVSFEANSDKEFNFRGVLFGDVTENW